MQMGWPCASLRTQSAPMPTRPGILARPRSQLHRPDQQPRRQCRTHDDPPGGRTTQHPAPPSVLEIPLEHTKRDPHSARDRPGRRPLDHRKPGRAPTGTVRAAPGPPPGPAGAMTPYVESHRGGLMWKFEMLPDPRRHVQRWAARRLRRSTVRTKRPRHPVADRSVLDGQVRGHGGGSTTSSPSRST